MHRILLAPILVVVLASGCDVPPRPPIGPKGPDRTNTAAVETTQGDETRSAGATAAAPWQSWSLYLRDGRPIGYQKIAAERAESDAAALRYEIDDLIDLRRGESMLQQWRHQRFVERAGGQLQEFESELRIGPSLARIRGDAHDSELVFEITRGHQTSQHRLPWGAAHRGPVAIEQSLRSEPMQVGDSRTLKMLNTTGLQIVDVQLHCVGEAVVPILDGSHAKLLEINRTDIVDGEVISESVLWTDQEGILQRWLVPALSAVAYRSTAGAIFEELPEIGPDETGRPQGTLAEVAIAGTIPHPSETRLTLFEVSLSDAAGDTERPMPITPGPGQWVKEVDDQTWQVLINHRNEKTAKGFTGDRSQFTEADLTPSLAIDHRSTAVQDVVKRTGPTLGLREEETGKLAEELTKLTNRLTTLDRSGLGITSASEVAKRARGDAIGQAILLAALMRAKKIPARVALGLRYNEGDPPSMRFHAWTVAWYDNHWHPFDATRGTAAAADRITLALLDLADQAEVDGHRRLLQTLHRLAEVKLKVLKARVVSSNQ